MQFPKRQGLIHIALKCLLYDSFWLLNKLNVVILLGVQKMYVLVHLGFVFVEERSTKRQSRKVHYSLLVIII
jgi:hypothetical protein